VCVRGYYNTPVDKIKHITKILSVFYILICILKYILLKLRILHLWIGSQTFVLSRYIQPLQYTSLRMATRVVETCRRNTFLIEYFIHLCAFLVFIVISKITNIFFKIWVSKIGVVEHWESSTVLYCNVLLLRYQFCIRVYNTQTSWSMKYVKVKESRNRPSLAQSVPGRLRSQISWHSAHEGGEVVSLTQHRPPLPPENFPGTHFHWGLSRSQGHDTVGRNMSLKNPVTPPGIDPRTVRLAAQCLNHYAIPGQWST